MGSYNLSCFVTKQTIASGDPARVLLLRDARGKRGRDVTIFDKEGQPIHLGRDAVHYGVGVESAWSPVGHSMKAIYDDYGVFKLADGEVDRASDLLKALHVHLSRAENDMRVGGFSPEALTTLPAQEAWETLMAVADRGMLFSKSCHPDGYRTIVVAAMHESAWQALLKIGMETTFEARDARSIETIDNIDAGIASGKESQRAAFDVLSGAFRFDVRDSVLNFVREKIGAVAVQYATSARSSADRATAIEVISDLWEDQLVFNGLGDLNLRLEPSLYAGQDYDNAIGREYLTLVSEVSADVSARRAFDDDFDHEDDGPTL